MRAVCALLLLAVGAARVSLIEEIVRVPASDWRLVLVPLRQRPATVVCTYVVAGPGAVRIAFMRSSDLRRFEEGRANRPLVSTGFERSGKFGYSVREPGEYAIVLDNRLEGRGPADVHLQVSLEFGGPVPAAWTLSPARRFTVVAVSLMVFFGIVYWSGRLLLRAMRAQRSPEPFPPFE